MVLNKLLSVVLSSVLMTAAGPDELLSDPEAQSLVSEAQFLFTEGNFGDAAKLIEKVRIQFSKTNLVFKQSRQCLGKITASFGIAAFQPGLDGRDLVEQADQKLYAAKNAGRNMIKADGID